MSYILVSGHQKIFLMFF